MELTEAGERVPVIELCGLTRLYGTVIGVNDLNLKLNPGCYGLVGPNGAGKTTLIGLLTGSLFPSRGEARIFGANPIQRRSLLSRVGVCPASELLIPRASARDWLVELLMIGGYSFRKSHDMAAEALVLTGMKDRMDSPIGSYSLGMRQRVKLAQAIAHDPELLILDEPFNGLDPVGRFEMSELLKEWSSRGKTLILASHVLPEVEAVTDAFILIYGGRLLATGSASELRAMVNDLPQQITLYGPDVEKLAGRMAEQPWVDSVRLSDDRNRLRIEARLADQLAHHVTRWVAEDNLRIDRMVGADGELASLFEVLTRRHRGYAR
ncbi:ABC transporter ATP-binding protein [Planctomycetaceae bacterium SH139]